MMKFFAFLALTLVLASCSQPDSQTIMQERQQLRHKVGQMLIMGFDGASLARDSAILQQIKDGQVGGVILFDYDYQKKAFKKNIESPEQVKALIQQCQQAAKQSPVPLPLFVSVDYEGGNVNRLKQKYGFPETLSAAKLATLSDELAHHYAVQIVETLKRVGFNLDFAPVVDLNRNSTNPIIGQLERSFSDDPETVTFYANMFADAFAAKNIHCAYKHFPGHGSSDADSHLGFVEVTDTWDPSELLPYQLSFKNPKHCQFVMSAHIVNRQLDDSGNPATLSKKILTELLRKKFKYDGIIITDDLQMQAITDNFALEDTVTMAINAGANMLIFGNQLVADPQHPNDIIDIVMKKIDEGAIKQKQIESSYKRIVHLKQKMAS